MRTIKINYKITIYGNKLDRVDVIDNLTEVLDYDILFSDMVEFLVKKNKISYLQIYVEKLKTLTWGKLATDDLLAYIVGDDYHYKWLNYKIGDINSIFNLFDNIINIIIDGPGIGFEIGNKEGIKFCIGSNEKDRHRYEPHVHCKYSGEKMRIRIDTLEVMKDDKPFKNTKKFKVAKEWIKLHQKSLLNFYELFAIQGKSDINFQAEI